MPPYVLQENLESFMHSSLFRHSLKLITDAGRPRGGRAGDRTGPPNVGGSNFYSDIKISKQKEKIS